MGTCVSQNQKELLNELRKHDNNQLILEHLKQNQENFIALTKSLNQIALLNRSEPNLSIDPHAELESPVLQARCLAHYNNDNPCHHHNCKCTNQGINSLTAGGGGAKSPCAKSLLLVALNNQDQQYLEQNKLIKKIANYSDDSGDDLDDNRSRYTLDSSLSKGIYQRNLSTNSAKELMMPTPESILRKKSHHQQQQQHHLLNSKQKPAKASYLKKSFGESSRNNPVTPSSTSGHYKCRHLSRSPNREMVYFENSNNNSSSLSTSVESIQYAGTNHNYYNETFDNRINRYNN